MNLYIFFNNVRASVFGGSLTVGQVEGMEKIIAYRDERYPHVTDEQFAYMLATIYWETAHKMQPVREMGGEAYLRTKKYYPWVGEGLVQVTWEVNHRKFGGQKPGDLMTWPIALYAAFEGMTKGIFTGKRLSDYVGGGKRDYVQARRIINGVDRAAEIASIATKFLRALEAATVRIPPLPPSVTPVAGMEYEQFCAWLVKAINEDANVRGALIAAIFPDDAPEVQEYDTTADPMDAPHDEYGTDQGVDYDSQTAAYEKMAYGTDKPDFRYG